MTIVKANLLIFKNSDFILSYSSCSSHLKQDDLLALSKVEQIQVSDLRGLSMCLNMIVGGGVLKCQV